jgi:hypothetical protein
MISARARAIGSERGITFCLANLSACFARPRSRCDVDFLGAFADARFHSGGNLDVFFLGHDTRVPSTPARVSKQRRFVDTRDAPGRPGG